MVKKICCIVFRREHDGVKYLILHKNNWWNGWEFVKGEKNENEGVEECAVREANEETGLNIVKVEQIPFHYS